MPDTYVKLAQPRSVEVLVDAAWHPGEVEAWRQVGGGWRAFVRYNAGVGLNHLAWVEADGVRPVD